MTLLKHELRRGKLGLMIWSAALSFMLGICILIYPEMAGQMEEMSSMFADMGSFTQAFGMDQLNFGEYKGYFGIECGNTLGLGGAIFAALLGISAIAKEEKDHTAEFLLTHPISRDRVYAEKLLSVMIQILSLNIVVALITLLATVAIGETLPVGETTMLLIAFTLLQIQIAGITFGLSAYTKGGSMGLGIGLALVLYFISLVANLLEKVEFLKYVTPFAYTDSGTIYAQGHPEWKYLIVGMMITAVVIMIGRVKWNRKDIQ